MALAGKVSQLSAALGGATDDLSCRVCTPMSPSALLIAFATCCLYLFLLYYTYSYCSTDGVTWHDRLCEPN